jgi:hypothetical protein
MHLLTTASYALPSFGPEDPGSHALPAQRMASGPGGPALVCFPTFFPGPGMYGRFASCFDGERDVFEVVADDTAMAAMGGYMRNIRDWRPRSWNAPTLFLRAGDPLPEALPTAAARSDAGWHESRSRVTRRLIDSDSEPPVSARKGRVGSSGCAVRTTAADYSRASTAAPTAPAMSPSSAATMGGFH